MLKFRKHAVVFLLIAAFMMTLVGCGGKTADTSKKADTSKEVPTYTVGSETTFPPFEMVDKDGKYTGFDMDLINAIAEAGGFKVKIQSQGFDGLIPALQTGNIDIIASGMTITEERKKSIDFSDPYIDAGLMIAVPADNTTITKPEDLKGKTIGVQIGTTGADFAANLQKQYPDIKIKTFNTVDLIFADMANKGCDAVINDKPVSADYIKKGHPEVKLVGEVMTGEQYGFAVKKGNAELLAKVNDGLKKVKASGKYDEIYKKYFGE
ncbi:MAG: basic amino acid ABC transporter substrate-binding protein [Methylocystaceae bacterium]